MFFTYDSAPSNSSLHQGDVIRRTPALDEVLADVHPHYLKDDYRFFAVLTQSCDLVLRDGKCKSRYITVAAVRPASLAISRYAERLQYSEVEVALGFAPLKRKARVQQFVERLLNNNEHDYFFLRAEPSATFPEDQCAFLQLGISLKAHLHYTTLLQAKILQLTQAFQHKLGYLVGTSYSRIGTDDWVPTAVSQKDFNQIAQSHVEGLNLFWIADDIHSRVLKDLEMLPAGQRTLAALEASIKARTVTPEQRRITIVSRVEAIATELGIPQDQVGKLTNRLDSDPTLRIQLSQRNA